MSGVDWEKLTLEFIKNNTIKLNPESSRRKGPEKGDHITDTHSASDETDVSTDEESHHSRKHHVASRSRRNNRSSVSSRDKRRSESYSAQHSPSKSPEREIRKRHSKETRSRSRSDSTKAKERSVSYDSSHEREKKKMRKLKKRQTSSSESEAESSISERSVSPEAPRKKRKAKSSSLEDDKNGKTKKGEEKLQTDITTYKITVFKGKIYSKEYILTELHEIHPFQAMAYHIEDKDVIFYIDDIKAAKIFKALKEVYTSDDVTLKVRAVEDAGEVTIADTQFRSKIKNVVMSRYNSKKKSLDLSSFYKDSDLIDSVFYPLYHSYHMECVVSTIVENIPELKYLDISGNLLENFSHIGVLLKRMESLEEIKAERNKITDLDAFSAAKGCKIKKLLLAGNPVCELFEKSHAYARQLKKYFPNLVKVDETEMEPKVVVVPPKPPEIRKEKVKNKTPSSTRGFLCNTSAKKVAREFLENFYIKYDDDRKALHDVYGEKAVFSLVWDNPPDKDVGHSEKLKQYAENDRNLQVIKYFYLLVQERLHFGKKQIVSLLSKLPATEHDPDSFCIDLLRCSGEMMVLSVTGIFREIDEDSQPARSFCRMFTAVCNTQGKYLIVNDILHMSNLTEDQSKYVEEKFALDESTKAMELLQNYAIDELAEKTGMKTEWCKKCLINQNWDYKMAVYTFKTLFKRNKIPQEAFDKAPCW